MRSKSRKRKLARWKSKLGLPDLDHAKAAVLASLHSPESERRYRHAVDDFVGWYCSEPRLSFNKMVVTRYRLPLLEGGLSWSNLFFGFAKLATEATCRCRTGRNRVDGLQQGIMEATL